MSGHFIYNNKKFRLKEIIETKNLKNDNLKIEIIFYKIIYNKSFMFKDCESLLKFSDFNCLKNQDYSQISEIINAPEEEENLFDFFEENKISENTLYQNIEDIESFDNFSQISKKQQKESDISTISNIYNQLRLIPDINNFLNLSNMFYNCSNLISLTDIPNLKKYEIIDMNAMFANCSSLVSLPDISQWNTKNVTILREMFFNCSSLQSIPDISNWDTNKVTDLCGLFDNFLIIVLH